MSNSFNLGSMPVDRQVEEELLATSHTSSAERVSLVEPEDGLGAAFNSYDKEVVIPTYDIRASLIGRLLVREGWYLGETNHIPGTDRLIHHINMNGLPFLVTEANDLPCGLPGFKKPNYDDAVKVIWEGRYPIGASSIGQYEGSLNPDVNAALILGGARAQELLTPAENWKKGLLRSDSERTGRDIWELYSSALVGVSEDLKSVLWEEGGVFGGLSNFTRSSLQRVGLGRRAISELEVLLRDKLKEIEAEV